MDIFSNHRKLYGTAFLLFSGLTLLVAVIPAINNQNNNHTLPDSKPLTEDQMEGKKVFIANGCVACHTQQVRNVEMDKVWGDRPGIAADYAGNERMSTWMNTATLMGTERTGPDLTNIGIRQPGRDWHLMHLFNPRSVVGASIMPAYPWLFEMKTTPDKNDVVVNVPGKFKGDYEGKIVAGKQALQLVDYLISLRQTTLPDGSVPQDFLYKSAAKKTNDTQADAGLPDGAELYINNCQSCHQSNGEGLAGAFPPLKGSAVVMNDDIGLMVRIIMQGYNPREEYAVMPAVGANNNLTAEQVAAIMNHEKSSWGNNAKKVTADDVKKIMEIIKTESK